MTTIGHAWVALIQSLAIIALVLTALGLMVGLSKPADCPEAGWGHSGHHDCAGTDPWYVCKPVVGHSFVAMDRSCCDWDCRLAAAATARSFEKR